MRKVLLGLIALALAGCHQSNTYRGFRCVNIETGLQLDHVNDDMGLLEDTTTSFTGTDPDGFQRFVPKQQTSNWKCKTVTYR